MSERSHEVSPYVTVSCTQVPVRKIPERLLTAWAYLINCFFLPCVLVCVWVHRRWSIERHRKSIDFGREGGSGGPYLAAPPTSARVQNRVEFVELARDMSSNCTIPGICLAKLWIKGKVRS